MPLVILTRNPVKISDAIILEFNPILQIIIAEALTCEDEGGQLRSDEIEIRVRESGRLDCGSVDLSIEIFANEYPARTANLEARTERIAEEIGSQSILPDDVLEQDGFVWVFLGKAAFCKF